MAQKISLLSYALMGLLYARPSSGYELRKMFAQTPLITFSDSPGAIYPALARLEEQGMVRGQIEETTGLRRKKTYRLSAEGLRELKKWLRKPVTREDIVWGMEEISLRFAFSDSVIGEGNSTELLDALERELNQYLPVLHEYLKSHGSHLTTSGRLSLEMGIRVYEAQLQWTRDALAIYQSGKKGIKK
jgi:DNA-binding PadR family transcriptional regulator